MTLISRPAMALRKLRLRSLLRLPLSTQQLMVYSRAMHEHMLESRDGAWLGAWTSPLGSYLDVTDGREARYAVDHVCTGDVPSPTGSLAPGIVAELLYACYMRHQFEQFVSENSVAYKHVMRLERLAPRNGGMLEDAQALAMSGRAKKAALDVLSELGIQPR